MKIAWEDIAQFVSLLLLSGYHHVPTDSVYWNISADTDVPITSTVVPRKKIKYTKRKFHLMDNALFQPSNMLGKIEPIYDELNTIATEFGLFQD